MLDIKLYFWTITVSLNTEYSHNVKSCLKFYSNPQIYLTLKFNFWWCLASLSEITLCLSLHVGNGEEKLKFYITSCLFCFCNSACSLQSLDHVGHVVSESGDLQYQELEFISLTLVLLSVIAQLLVNLPNDAEEGIHRAWTPSQVCSC